MAGIIRRALLDLDALVANLEASAMEELDARADAFGHGIALVGPIARDAGVAAIRVSSDHDAEAARRAGFREIRVDRGGAPDARAYGLDGRGTPILTLEAEIIATKRVAAGAGVSYGYTYRTPAAATLALVGLGYADGVPRLASNRAEARIGASRHTIAGRIAMDQFVVDCADDEPAVGDLAVLFGDPRRGVPSATEWATWTEREALALTAGLGPRVSRIVAGSAS